MRVQEGYVRPVKAKKGHILPITNSGKDIAVQLKSLLSNCLGWGYQESEVLHASIQLPPSISAACPLEMVHQILNTAEYSIPDWL